MREANKILAATSDCNAIYCRLDPREGAKVAVAEAARNLACSGAVPLAVTDNLNFGNPHKPENFLMLREAVEGLAEACREFNTPVTGGNVSLYNESPNGTIDPTPTVGMVGQIADMKHVTTQAFKAGGDVILLLGNLGDEIGGSHYLKVVHGQKPACRRASTTPRRKALHNGVREIIRKGLVQSAHDLSEGGIAVAVAEVQPLGQARARRLDRPRHDGPAPGCRALQRSQSRIIVSVTSENAAEAESVLKSLGVPVQRIGPVNSTGTLQIAADGKSYSWPLSDLETAWGETIGKLME